MISDEERRSGAIVFHIFGAIYFFVLLAVVCNDYFLPSVECVCEDLNISKVNFNRYRYYINLPIATYQNIIMNNFAFA